MEVAAAFEAGDGLAYVADARPVPPACQNGAETRDIEL